MAQIVFTTEWCWYQCPKCKLKGMPYTRARDVRIDCHICRCPLNKHVKKGIFIVVASRTVESSFRGFDSHRRGRLLAGKVDGRMTLVDDSPPVWT